MVKIGLAILYFLINIIFAYGQDEKFIDDIILQSSKVDEEILKISFYEKPKPQSFDLNQIKIKSFSAENAPLKAVLYGILQNSGLSLIFDPEVDTLKPLTLQFKDTSLENALRVITETAKVGFEIDGNVIKIKPTIVKMFKLPYIKTKTASTSTLGGNITGGGIGVGGAGGGTAGGGTTGGGTTGGGATSGQMGVTGRFSLTYTGDEENFDIFTQIENNIRDLLSPKGKLTINKMTGIVIVEDYPDKIKLVEKYLARVKKEIDKQVLIEAKIVEVSLSDGYKFGIDWNLFAKNVFKSAVSFSQNLSLTSSAATLTVVSSDFNAVINAIATYGKINTLSNPRLLVMNNQTALISSGNIVPFWEKQVNIIGGTINTQPYTTSSYTKTNVLDGVLLGVTPHIEDDGDITLNIVPISSKIVGTKELREGSNVVAEAPIMNIKESGTVVKIKDGDMIIIGGLISKNNSVSETKVPGLGDIPLIGNIFKQKSVSEEVKELVIFMKVVKIDKDTPY